MSPRQAIREAMRAVLLGKTIAGDGIATNRPNPLSQRPSALGGKIDLPAILIVTDRERSEIFDESPRRYRRTCEVTLELAMEVVASTQIDDDLDAFAQHVEALLLADDTLGGVANDTVLTGTTLAVRDHGARLIGAVTLALDVTYFTYAPEAGTQTLPALATVHTEYPIGQTAPDDRAVTHLEGLAP